MTLGGRPRSGRTRSEHAHSGHAHSEHTNSDHARRGGVARSAVVVVDLGFGDQGKGSITDFLVRDRGAELVVRFNGGAQAGHNVVTDDGRHHTFSQFGAGMFSPGTETLLAAPMVIQPWAMCVEADALARVGVADVFERTWISGACPVITPFHRAANRLRERARGEARHGSCGIGFGETVHDALYLGETFTVRARELFDRPGLGAKMHAIREAKRAALAPFPRGEESADLEDPRTVEVYLDRLAPFLARARVVEEDAIAHRIQRAEAIIFEGAQGVLLDQDYGFQPYTTWSRCTFDNALELLEAVGFDGEILRLGVLRAYATRHGAGPFPTEDHALPALLPDVHNGDHPFQGMFRVGWFDAVAARYAIEVCRGVDGLAITCLDRLAAVPELKLCDRYGPDGRPLYQRTEEAAFLEAIEAAVGAPVVLTSRGPTASSKSWRHR